MAYYIDFGVAPYALPKVCEALWNNGVHNAFLTMEDGDIHVRWEYDINREKSRISPKDLCRRLENSPNN